MSIDIEVDELDTNNNLLSSLALNPQEQQKSSDQLEEHYIRSIDATVVIRQLQSLGLSFQLWPAATTLVNLLSLQDQPRAENDRANPISLLTIFSLPSHRLRVLELGSGTGLVGISFAVALGCHVTLTDLPHVLPNLNFNAEANSEAVSLHGGEVQVAALSWGDKNEMDLIGRDYDLILGSDVVYYDHLYDPLLSTLKYLMVGRSGSESASVVFVMGHLKRWKKENVFFKKAKKMFDVKVIHTDEPCDGRRLGVVVYKFEVRK